MRVQQDTADLTCAWVDCSLLHCAARLHRGMTDPSSSDMMDPCMHPTDVHEECSDTGTSTDCMTPFKESVCASCLACGADEGQHECENATTFPMTDLVPTCFSDLGALFLPRLDAGDVVLASWSWCVSRADVEDDGHVGTKTACDTMRSRMNMPRSGIVWYCRMS